MKQINLNNSLVIHTNMQRKENIKELFFNNSSKHWHFEEIIKESKLSRTQANEWLKRLIKEKIIIKVKNKDKMPYYVGNFNSPSYKNSKRIYSLQKLYNLGFLDHLLTLKKAKTIIIFGSLARSDWNENSDLDIFIYGDNADFNQGKYESKLKREIQLFSIKYKRDFKKFRPELLKNIVNGYVVKGNLDFMEIKCLN